MGNGGKESPIARRCRQLRRAEGYGRNATAFAKRLGISIKRWSNFENGHPLSNEVAILLVQRFPGLTLDWLYFGVEDGLTRAMAARLEEAEDRSCTPA